MDRISTERPIHILEVGFGTGLNLLLLLERLAAMENKPRIIYHAVDAFPLSVEEAMKLNYPAKIDLPNASEVLASVFGHNRPGCNTLRISPQVNLELYCGPFDQWPQPSRPVDIIFFDPFSPDVNPDLWTESVFRKLKEWANPDSLLMTYGAASASRAAMAAAGWHLAGAQGALGKREMTLASPGTEPLEGFKRLNEERLATRYRQGEFSQDSIR